MTHPCPECGQPVNGLLAACVNTECPASRGLTAAEKRSERRDDDQ